MAHVVLRSGPVRPSLRSAPLVRRRCFGARRRARSQSSGFTLVEMAIVVVIIGILSVLAVVGYKKMIASSNMSEATHMVNAIRVAQEAYHAETQLYANPSGALTNMYPQASPSNLKTGWGGACTACTGPDSWQVLPVHADGAVLYGYATVGATLASGTSVPSVPSGGCWPTISVTFPTTLTADWYVISALGDPDNNGVCSAVIGTSWTNDIFTYNEGE